jgi:hypothetical protein
VKNLRPDIDIYLVGSDEAPELWFEYVNCGILNLQGLNDLYNKCHLGLCLSSSNPSCNPFDMMASGLPSVELYRDNNLYDLPEDAILLAHQTPESIAEALIYLLDDARKRQKMSEFGVKFMSERTKKAEIDRFLSIINMIDIEKIDTSSKSTGIEKYKAKAVIATVCQNESVNTHVVAQFNSFSSHYEPDKISENLTISQSFGLVGALSTQNIYKVKRSLFIKIKNLLKRWLGL